MSRPRTYRSEGVVLRSAPFAEDTAMVTLYSTNSGKLKAVVRGAHKPTSKMVGHLEPLNRVELALASPRLGGIHTVTQAQVLESFSSLKANLESVSRGLYLAELVDGYGTEGGANRELYSLLVDTLRVLNEDSINGDSALRYFELHLLRCSGFMPELYRCVECGDELSPGRHRFSPQVGGALCLRCTPADVRVMPFSLQALKVLRHVHRGSLEDLTRLHVPGSLAEELKNLLSACLKYWLDKEIRSRSFMDHLEDSRKAVTQVAGSQSTSP